jgi:hypothetical protein
MVNRSGENVLPPSLSIRQRLFELAAPPSASADDGPALPERQSTARESVFAEWLLPGAIAAVLTGGPALFGGRGPEHQTRGIDGFLNRKRPPFKFPGEGHAQRD